MQNPADACIYLAARPFVLRCRILKPAVKTFITIAVTAAVTFSGTAVLFAVSGDGSGIGAVSSGVNSDTVKKLNTVYTYLKNNYLYEDYDSAELGEEAVKAYVDALGEPYTHYYTADEFESYISNIEESYVGIGVVISVDEEAEKIIVISPTEGSPAQEAGILPGDYILAVDGTEFGGSEMDECVSMIKSGVAGTKVVLTVERDGTQMDIEVERREIVTESVSSEMLSDNIGYVRISEFNVNENGSDESTYTEFVDNVSSLQEQGMEKMIIDLRDNPGGVLDVVCDIADYILPEGLITYTETRTGEREEYMSDASELDIPIVILINGNSASSSEVLTLALHDHEKAIVVGEKSYGKGIVQSVYPFSDGSGMSMTTAKYYSPNGTCIHGVGIEPDYTVELTEEYRNGYASDIPHDADTQLNKAIELLKSE